MSKKTANKLYTWSLLAVWFAIGALLIGFQHAHADSVFSGCDNYPFPPHTSGFAAGIDCQNTSSGDLTFYGLQIFSGLDDGSGTASTTVPTYIAFTLNNLNTGSKTVEDCVPNTFTTTGGYVTITPSHGITVPVYAGSNSETDFNVDVTGDPTCATVTDADAAGVWGGHLSAPFVDRYWIFTAPQSSTAIVITNPTQGTSTPSNTLDIDANYTVGTDLSSFSLDGSLPNRIGIDFTLQSTNGFGQIDLGTDWDISSSTGSHSYATSTVQQTGDYTLTGTLVGDYGLGPPPPAGCVPYPPFQDCTTPENISTLVTSAPPITFSLNNGLFPELGFQVGSSSSQLGLATTTCDILNISGCMQNAIAFLFYPDPLVLAQFQFLWFNVRNKPPFGYATQTFNAFNGLNASSTPAFTFPSLPLMDAVFTPLRDGIASILWFFFGYAMFKIVSNIDL